MKDYYLGIDIGTDSVGFAVTDPNYNVIKKGKKDIIGLRLFETGKTAEETRNFRTNRRRLDRKKQRIVFLQQLFEQEISKVDPSFFMRLKESMYHFDDKTINQKNSLFNDSAFTDKDYYKDYKTIYHLRKALINGEVDDVRLLYLGIEHIIKHRGHFLLPDADLGSIKNFDTTYNALNNYLLENHESFALKITDTQKLQDILKDSSKKVRDKATEIQTLLPSKVNNKQKSLIDLLVGKSVSLEKIFLDIDFDDITTTKNISFKNDIEELYDEISGIVEDDIQIIDYAKAVYDWALLADILYTSEESSDVTISDAKVYQYRLHHAQLKTFKDMVKKYLTAEDYKEIFSNCSINNNYVAYIGSNSKNGKKQVVTGKCNSQVDFCNYVLSKFKGIEIIDNEHLKALISLENHTFLSKLRVGENAIIPYQVHYEELKKILLANSEKFSFLKSVTDEYSAAEKIEKIFLFRVPYYVGPLHPHSDYAWICRNKEKINPWNFEKVVDIEQSAENFIQNLTSRCTYLKDEDVIPKQSLLYSKFSVLNELNTLKLNGEPISVELKQNIYHDLFENKEKITSARLKKYLIKNSYADIDVIITGVDKDFKNSLSSYIKFKNILGNVDDNIKMIENIINWLTIFDKEKKFVKSRIEKAGYDLSAEQIKKILNLRFSGWGRFSKKLLTEIYQVDTTTGEAVNIIDFLYQSNLNFMQILSNQYKYLDAINSCNQTQNITDITHKKIEELYCSPAVKKSIWQAVQIVKEIEKVMGEKPKKLFIEVTRSEGEKKTTTSRKNALKSLYASVKKDYPDLYTLLDSKTENDLRVRKLYLYFTQLGRCAYTGEEITLSNLFDNNLYDIDHIYPRSKVKDDSIHNNLVLVDKNKNRDKTNIYPIPEDSRQPKLWKLLYDKNLITNEKYNRLTRTDEFTPSELQGFIARQLVETSQSSKAVAKLMEEYYQDTGSVVVYVKAGYVSDFRQLFNLPKSREINDYHHAHDAYLNIVVGNIHHTKFTENFFKNIKRENYSLKPEVFYTYDVKGKDTFAWKNGNNGTIKTVKNTVENAKILFTRQSHTNTGGLFNETIYKKGHGDFPVKSPIDPTAQQYKLTNLEKYGGFKSISGAYFCVVKHTTGKKEITSIEYVPIYLASQIEKDSSMLEKYLQEKLNLINPTIKLRKLKFNSLLNIDGMPMHISGRSDGNIIYKGAAQLKLSTQDYNYICKIEKFIAKLKKTPTLTVEHVNREKTNPVIISLEENLNIYLKLIDKLQNTIYKTRLATQAETLKNKLDIFKELSVENQCQMIINILSLFKCNATTTNFSLISEGSNVGKLRLSKNITNFKKCTLIHQSITGVYENQLDLLK